LRWTRQIPAKLERHLAVLRLRSRRPAAISQEWSPNLRFCLRADISPIRAELTGVHRTGVLTLTNADDDAVVVQVHVVAWSQQNGEERLDETRDLLVTPPVLQIPAKGEQIVRVALRREPDALRELTYRVIFEEVPQAAPVNFTGLRVALRLSVPIFVAPTHGQAAAALTWEAHRLQDGEVEVAATNHGTGHLQVSDFNLGSEGRSGLQGMTSKYVLPGSRMTWTLRPNGADAIVPARSNGTGTVIHGHSDQGDFSADVALSGL
jgi:fimbrial chaperone protein